VYLTPQKPHQLSLFTDPRGFSVDRVHAVYMTRPQTERHPEGHAKAEDYLHLGKRSLAAQSLRDALVMHPLPRRDEISSDIDDDPRSIYFKQAARGVPIRMAILAKAPGEDPDERGGDGRDRAHLLGRAGPEPVHEPDLHLAHRGASRRAALQGELARAAARPVRLLLAPDRVRARRLLDDAALARAQLLGGAQDPAGSSGVPARRRARGLPRVRAGRQARADGVARAGGARRAAARIERFRTPAACDWGRPHEPRASRAAAGRARAQ
jgi:hypothetical protein